MNMSRRSHFLDGPQQDPCPDLVIELGPDGNGVGQWVHEDKHRLVAEYLYATRYAWASPKWTGRVWIDPFCGPGRVRVRDEVGTRDGGVLVAWRESVAGGFPFTHVFIGDKNQERVEACAARLRALGAPVTAFVGVASETVPQMVKAVPRRGLAMAYVDPYNLQLLSFDLFRELARLRSVDIAAHFSTMDLLRNAEMEFDPGRARFDSTAPGWRNDPDILSVNRNRLPVEFFRYWERLVTGLGFSCSKEMPLVLNDAGHPIYRLVFFARHDMPLRVWADVAKNQGGQIDLI